LLGFAPVAAALASTSNLSHAENYSPPTASIVVDGYSGAVLQASNPDALRHPASLTKIMTLYLLFERLEAGEIKLDSTLKVSEYASEQAPTSSDSSLDRSSRSRMRLRPLLRNPRTTRP
jgi:D-alanyl-D-alanine carboxypeptidase